MKRTLIKIVCVALFLCVIVSVLPNDSFFVSALVRSKSQTISDFMSLCDAHPSLATYETIGKSLQGKDIWIFRFGNPKGGRVMWDSQLHGNEDLGNEIFWIFVQWLLTSGDAKAKTFLQNNYLLIIPVIDVDSDYRCNMRRQYVLANGTKIYVTQGVNLNRNFPVGWGSYGSTNPSSQDYMGLYGASEPETRAVINAFRKYKPAVYLNTHQWAGPQAWIGGDSVVTNTIIQTQSNYFGSVKPTYDGTAISAYPVAISGFAGGTAPRQAFGMYLGTTSCLVELDPCLDQFKTSKYSSVSLYGVQKYYYPKFLGFLYGTLNAASQNPSYGSIDFDATVNGALLSTPTTYKVTFPNGTIKSYNRAGGVLYNCPAGTYSVSATVNGETRKSVFSVVSGSQAKILLQFGSSSPLLSDNFEQDFPGKWTLSRTYGESVALSTDQSVSGTHSAKFSVDGLQNSGQMAYISRQLVATKKVYVQAKVRFSSLPVAGYWCPVNVRATTDSPGAFTWIQVEKRTSGVVWVCYWRDSAAKATRSKVISGIAVNAQWWYSLEIYVKVDTPTTGEVKCWINGNLVLDQTGINNTEWLDGVQYMQFGERWASPYSGAHSVYVDDVTVASSYIP